MAAASGAPGVLTERPTISGRNSATRSRRRRSAAAQSKPIWSRTDSRTCTATSCPARLRTVAIEARPSGTHIDRKSPEGHVARGGAG